MTSWLYDQWYDYLCFSSATKKEKLQQCKKHLPSIIQNEDDPELIEMIEEFLSGPRKVAWKKEGF